MEQSAPRVVEADRSQLELRAFDLDSTTPQDHRARLVWRAVETLDLSGFYERIRSRVGTAGRPPGDPKVFVALWLYATMGGVGVNYHTLSDFRAEHGPALDELLTQTLAVLLERRLIELKRVAQDGLRVRASAGADSFRRKKKLRHYLKEARARGARPRGARQRGAGGAAGSRAEAARGVQRRAQGEGGAARLDHGPAGPHDAHGQRRLPPRVQRAVRGRRGARGDCGRERNQQRQWASAADDRAAHGAQAKGVFGGCRLHGQEERGAARRAGRRGAGEKRPGSLPAAADGLGRRQCVEQTHGQRRGPRDLQGARAHHRAGQRGRPDLPHHGSDARPGAAARCSGMPWRSICCARWPSDRSVERRRAATLGAPSAPRDGGGSPSWHVTPVSFTSEVYLPHRARRHGAHSPVPGNPNSFTSFSSPPSVVNRIRHGPDVGPTTRRTVILFYVRDASGALSLSVETHAAVERSDHFIQRPVGGSPPPALVLRHHDHVRVVRGIAAGVARFVRGRIDAAVTFALAAQIELAIVGTDGCVLDVVRRRSVTVPSSGSSLTTDTNSITGLGSQTSRTSIVASIGRILWLGGHSVSGSRSTEISGGVVSPTGNSAGASFTTSTSLSQRSSAEARPMWTGVPAAPGTRLRDPRE